MVKGQARCSNARVASGSFLAARVACTAMHAGSREGMQPPPTERHLLPIPPRTTVGHRVVYSGCPLTVVVGERGQRGLDSELVGPGGVESVEGVGGQGEGPRGPGQHTLQSKVGERCWGLVVRGREEGGGAEGVRLSKAGQEGRLHRTGVMVIRKNPQGKCTWWASGCTYGPGRGYRSATSAVRPHSTLLTQRYARARRGAGARGGGLRSTAG
jgi:hypothetical protein